MHELIAISIQVSFKHIMHNKHGKLVHSIEEENLEFKVVLQHSCFTRILSHFFFSRDPYSHILMTDQAHFKIPFKNTPSSVQK